MDADNERERRPLMAPPHEEHPEVQSVDVAECDAVLLFDVAGPSPSTSVTTTGS